MKVEYPGPTVPCKNAFTGGDKIYKRRLMERWRILLGLDEVS